MAHINEKIDYCVETFIVHNNKVLLRMHDKYKIWLSIGGHIELDEDPVEAVYREVKEEVGLEIEIIGEAHGIREDESRNRGYQYLIPPRFMGRHPVSDNHEHIALVYFAKANTHETSDAINDHEKTETIWASMEELDEMDLVPNVLFYAKEALKELAK